MFKSENCHLFLPVLFILDSNYYFVSAFGGLPGRIFIHPQHSRHESVAHHPGDAAQQERHVRPLHGLGPLLPGIPRTFHGRRAANLRRTESGEINDDTNKRLKDKKGLSLIAAHPTDCSFKVKCFLTLII